MNIGRFTIEQLSEGQFEVYQDGSFRKMENDEKDSSRQHILSADTSATVGIDPIYVTDGESHILLDTGLGWGLDAGSSYKDVSNVKTNLDIFGCAPDRITHVILTHLHYDHAAGSTYTGPKMSTLPTFPNAIYFVQKREWEYALSRVGQENPVPGADYRLDDFYRLIADDRVRLIDEDMTEIIPGIRILWTGGHTPGHQVVRIHDAGKSAYYLGDLLPSEEHLNHYSMRQVDIDPLEAKKIKIQLLRKVCNENACLLFYHSLFSKAGRLEKDEQKKYVLKEV